MCQNKSRDLGVRAVTSQTLNMSRGTVSVPTPRAVLFGSAIQPLGEHRFIWIKQTAKKVTVSRLAFTQNV